MDKKMTNRGRPLPIKVREEIRYFASTRMKPSRIATTVGVSLNTVKKYLPKFDRTLGKVG